jgi:hypothetical protein
MARRRGGAGSSTRTVPTTLPAGGDYGDRKALAELQSAAPMSPQQNAGGGASPVTAARGGTPAGRPMPGADFGRNVFSPSQRPGEPVTAGMDWGPGLGAPPRRDLADDRLLLLKVLFERNPSPQLARLLASVSTRRGR